LRMLWEHRDRQRELSAPATPSQPQDRNFTKRTETRPAETEPRGSSPKGCDRAVINPPQPSDTPHRAAGATSPPQAPHLVSGRFSRHSLPTRAPSSRKPFPRNLHQKPKKQFYETNRNPPRRNRAAREQPEGLRPSGSNTTSSTFRHPPVAPQARPVRRKPQRVSPRLKIPLALARGLPQPHQRLPPTVREGPTVPPPSLQTHAPQHPNPKPRFYETNRNPPQPASPP
jgi:hypothetical protein